jgi:FixJ family two-component response regulator
MHLKPTVFIVDDDPSVCQSLCNLLRTVNLPVETFSSGIAFLERVDPDQPGCVVIDLRMPGMSGLELQAQLCERGVRLPS